MSNKRPEVRELASAKNCQSYAPGHQVHWIQARVKRAEPKIDVQLKILDLNRLEVSSPTGSDLFLHHNTALISRALERMVNHHIKFAPIAKLLEIQTELPDDNHGGTFALFYLATGSLTSCWKPNKPLKIAPEN